MQEKLTLPELLAKYKAGTLSEEERALLENFITQHTDPEYRIDDKAIEADLAAIAGQLPLVHKTRTLWPRIAAAASILLIVGLGNYFLRHQPTAKNQLAYQNDVKPGANGAILTLSNGKKIILEQAKTGTIARQSGSRVNKAADSLLVYQPGTATATLTYNTLETPKGRQLKVVLADGTEVWLNAASSLRYPVAFNGKERVVELTGEAYFKVVHNAAQPFRVKTGSQTIEDIGTEFNVNAYTDEPAVVTTLAQGKVKVSATANSVFLKPGEDAIGSNSLSVKPADLESELAWKNGDFVFENEHIESIMRKLARWYDIDVTYQGGVPQDVFDGEISRFKNISQVLLLLEQTKAVHFKVEGRRVTVRK